MSDFTPKDASSWLVHYHFPIPNESRLKTNLATSGHFVRGRLAGSFRIHAKDVTILSARFPYLSEKSEDIFSEDTILPHSLCKNTRGFIERFSKQINSSYEHNIFDGCAVLMRRLIEILLIMSYERLNIEQSIKDPNGRWNNLSTIISDAQTNATLGLSQDTARHLLAIKDLGNLSAHKIEYNTRRGDIDKIALQYRVAIEELLNRAGLI